MMKKFVLLILMLASGSVMADWVRFDSTELSTSYFMPSEVAVDDGFAYVSVLLNFEKSQALSILGKAKLFYASKLETVLFDCSTKKFSIPDYSYHAEKNGKGEVRYWVSTEPGANEWTDTSTDPMHDLLFKKIRKNCDQN
jgi:hypothetical protein